MPSRKSIVVIMNCAALEIAAYLRASTVISENYEVSTYTTYVNLSDDSARQEIYAAAAAADVLITQNVQEIDWLRNDELVKIIKDSCVFIRLVFWRFEGFWPIPLEKKIGSLWYLPLEGGPKSTFQEYISLPVPASQIQDKFHEQLEKFEAIDKSSDISMMDFFIERFRHYNLFSDYWHPSSYFYYEVVRRIIRKLGHEPDIALRPNNTINRDRYRFVLDAVREELGLDFDTSVMRFNDFNISREIYFEFCLYAQDRLKTGDTREAEALFKVWAGENGKRVRAVDIAVDGIASQSSQSAWSFPGDAQRAAIGSPQGGYSFHTDCDPTPWWAIDLRDFRELSNICVWNRDGHGDEMKRRASPLSIYTSLDGETWDCQARINYVFGGAVDGLPLRLDFAIPVMARHVKVQTERSSCLHLDQVQLFSSMMR